MDTNTFIGNMVDRGPWILWDRITAAAGAAIATQLFPFSVGISSTKTKLDTNLQKGNQLPPPQRFLVQGIGFYFSSVMLKTDIDQILDGCYFEFRIDQKVYHEGLLSMFPAGIGLDGAGTKTNEAAWVNGSPSLTAMRRFGEYSRLISDNQQFSMNLTFPTQLTLTSVANGGTGLNLICLLDGILDRTVQ